MVAKKKVANKPVPEPTNSVDGDTQLPGRAKALVFVSHDSRDADIAEAFANLLSDVSAGTLKSFRSSDKKGNTGIEFGAEWYTSIMSQLGDATDVVALLTARSIDRPWILYEAGVARGKLETTVFGLALGVPLEKVSTGPFGQFQNCGDDEDSLTKLVMQLLQRNPDAAPREEAVRLQVRLFIESLSKLTAPKPKKLVPNDTVNEEQNVAKLFEEVKAMVRELPERMDDRVRNAMPRIYGKVFRRFSPSFFEAILSRISSLDKNKKAATLLIVLSLIKDEAIWLYEPGMEIYRAIVKNDIDAQEEAYMQLISTVQIMEQQELWGRLLVRPDNENNLIMTTHSFLRLVEKLVGTNRNALAVHTSPIRRKRV